MPRWLCWALLWTAAARGEVAKFDAGACWAGGRVSREDCCDVAAYGPYGNPVCWTHGFSFGLCCVKDPETAAWLRWLRDSLSYHLSAHYDVPAAVQADDFKFHLEPEMTKWAWEQGDAIPPGPARTTVVLLRALAAAPGSELVDEAFRELLSPSRPLVAHLESGYPVFALLLILGRHSGQGAWPGGDLAVRGNSTEKASDWCLGGCSERRSAARACALACVESAAALPPPHSRRGQCSMRSALEPLRASLLREAGRALRRLRHRRRLLGLSRAWAGLHYLQLRLHFQASCPKGSMRYVMGTEPPSAICLPTPSSTLRGQVNKMDVHMFTSIHKMGRWIDCDMLKDATVMAGMAGCAGCVAVDVGAALGACSSFLLAAGFRVHAVDPVLWNVALIRAALWEAECTGQLSVHHAFAGREEVLGERGAASIRAWAQDDEEPVGTVKLDQLLYNERGWMVLKIDVEGEELSVLQGAERLLDTGQVRAVLVEVHCVLLRDRGIDPWDVLALLQRGGFEMEVREPREIRIVGRASFERALLAAPHPNLKVLATRPLG